MSDEYLANENTSASNQARLGQKFSLLYPADHFPEMEVSFPELSSSAWHDLQIEQVAAALSTHRDFQKDIAKVLRTLVQEPAVIVYRQEILEDLLNNPSLAKRLAELLSVIDSLVRYSFHALRELTLLHEVAWRMGELQNIVDCIQGLTDIFEEAHDKISSAGLTKLEKEIHAMGQDPTFQHLVRALPDLLAKTRTCASLTIGVNLDANMRPVQATLLAINDEPFTGQSLLGKIFGVKRGQEGLAPLHSVPQRFVEGQVALPISTDLGYAVDPMMVPLFADLSRILEKTARPIANELQRYAELHGSLFTHLRHDLIFYLGAVQLIQRLREAGLPACRPEILPTEARICEVQEGYNLNLALNQRGGGNLADAIVTNEVHISPEEGVLILTGPNQGGKTTYMQGVGLAQVLGQAGCFVPGKQARISLVDQIFTHFPIEEKPDLEMGRLGEEATRLEKIFRQITRYSLVLLNESLASTSSVESLYLAQDVVRALRRVGARAIYSTHLHELAYRAGEINQAVPGDSQVASLVSSPIDLEQNAPVAELNRTFKIEKRPPLGQSFAHEIATRYGISYEQLERSMKERGALE